MLGLFDSGMGGLNTVRYLKASKDDRDLIYLIDRNNAPYGIKSEKELIEITKNNIKSLTGMGAERVLIACCTASTVHSLLPIQEKEASIPIIYAVAKEAKNQSQSKRIGVIATEHTVSSHAFKNALDGCFVKELALSRLVSLIDGGLSDDTVTADDEKMLEDMILPILSENIDTRILGCTHFSSLILTISKFSEKYGKITIVDSARVGADILKQQR